MADEQQFSETTYRYIVAIDAKMKGKYSISLNSILTNPDEYLGKAGMLQTIKDMRNDVNDYFDSMVGEHSEDATKFNEDLKTATDLYNVIDASVQAKAKEANVPYVEPIAVDRNEDLDESIAIEDYGDEEERLVEKLVNRSDYIADLSTVYKDFVLGSWLFSGSKARLLSINQPFSIILEMESSRAEIIARLDYILG